jgi:hypothetical protein
MKRDVDMHHQWAEKLKGLLEKQISYKADLQQKIELTMLETEDMQKAFKQCIADKQRAHIDLVSNQKLHDELEAKRSAQFKKRQETESYYAIEREKVELVSLFLRSSVFVVLGRVLFEDAHIHKYLLRRRISRATSALVSF